MTGFKPQRNYRIAVRNEQGEKIGYLASDGGRQVFQGVNGEKIAVIKAFKRDCAPSRQGAQGGCVINNNNNLDWWSQ